MHELILLELYQICFRFSGVIMLQNRGNCLNVYCKVSRFLKWESVS